MKARLMTPRETLGQVIGTRGKSGGKQNLSRWDLSHVKEQMPPVDRVKIAPDKI